jgi:uncharacterized protein YbjT (DUF2867 family)
MRILVLGGYGFIGAEICRALRRAGWDVLGAGRHPEIGRRLLPEIEWIGADIGRLTGAEDWSGRLGGVDAIVNAAGALQDGGGECLSGVHVEGVRALVAAAEKAHVRRFIQISAPGAIAGASTAFLSTKAAGDAIVRASALDWVVFKPGLVLGRNAFGGTSLLRLLAAIPFVEALAMRDAKVQTVAIDDVTEAVRRALAGDVRMRADYDLVEPAPHRLADIVAKMRAWLGFPPPAIRVATPAILTQAISALADIAGQLGWRSPLRSTALSVMSENVLGDPGPWSVVFGRPLKTLDETLADMPATAQERVYARAQLALPFLIAGLAAFWIFSGVMGLFRLETAATYLARSFGAAAPFAVIFGSIADIVIGAGLIVRRHARRAALAATLLAGLYLILGTVVAPGLWLDPMGPYAKIVPAILASMTLVLLLEDR